MDFLEVRKPPVVGGKQNDDRNNNGGDFDVGQRVAEGHFCEKSAAGMKCHSGTRQRSIFKYDTTGKKARSESAHNNQRNDTHNHPQDNALGEGSPPDGTQISR